MKAFVLFFLILLMVSSGCRKKHKYYDISDEYKSYFIFNEGSNWIYYNSLIDKSDSIVLRRITQIATKPDNVCGKYRYEYNLQFTSVTTGKLVQCQTSCVSNTGINDGFTSAVLTVPPAGITMYMDTLWVNGVKYHNVLVYNATDTLFNTVFAAYAKNIGRIMSLEIKNGDTIADLSILRHNVTLY